MRRREQQQRLWLLLGRARAASVRLGERGGWAGTGMRAQVRVRVGEGGSSGGGGGGIGREKRGARRTVSGVRQRQRPAYYSHAASMSAQRGALAFPLERNAERSCGLEPLTHCHNAKRSREGSAQEQASLSLTCIPLSLPLPLPEPRLPQHQLCPLLVSKRQLHQLVARHELRSHSKGKRWQERRRKKRARMCR